LLQDIPRSIYGGGVAIKRGRYASGVKRREEILFAAYQLISEHGHHAVTMKSVADAINVTEPALYYHFPTRDELFVEVLKYRDNQSMTNEAVAHPGYDAMIENMRHAQLQPWLMALYSEFAARAIDPEHAAHQFFIDHYDGLRAVAVDAIDAWLGEGHGVSEVEAERIMLEVAAAADGLQSRWLVSRNFDIADHIASVIERLAPRSARNLTSADH
jgi:AcrR family transcriptional regulator